ncbi:amino acid ABC transporter permease [Ruminococcaceae bacterium OttesenSCG-928-N02]|nr:amino acid ABC transporter permease [Ruminococcaceae bacterium OttesenSCG-928-N02]
MLANVIKLWGKYSGVFLQGALMTVQMSVITVLLGLLLGSVLAFMKLSNWKIGKFNPLRTFSSIYVSVLRGTPILLQLYFFYFVLADLNLSTAQSVLVALVVNSAAYVAEIIRAGISAVDVGQVEAARSLGLSGRQTMLQIVLPQAVKNILPAMGNELIMMIKETSLASTFFVGDLMTQANIIAGASFLQVECLIIAGIIYLVLTSVIGKLVNIFEKRLMVSD